MKFSVLFLFAVLTWSSYAQHKKDFSVNKQFYLKGNSTLIGNNIISFHKTKPFNDATKFNDKLKLKYVDIDDDNSTFSSSQASLTIPENSSIKYAALYWSAIYPYNIGRTKRITLKNKNEQLIYVGDDKRDLNINSVLLKTPNNNTYTPINGSIIFDEKNTKTVDNAKPYVCYADITSILQNAANPNGDYTLANIKATQGFAPGGCAGGWLLYVVYENKTESLKYFTTYNGFVDVFKKPVNILFQNFKAPNEGDIKASLLLGALEGDLKFKTDNCAFLDSENKNYIPLYNKIRPKLNFFNSNISINEKPFLNRLPASRNTLGFDLLKIEIPNSNNAIISNNSTQTTVQFNSKADRFYLYFVAFETEISPEYLERKEKEDKANLVLKKDSELKIKEDLQTEKEETPILVSNKVEEPKIDKGLEKIKNSKSITIPSVPKGYYLVTNVFSQKENAAKWMNFLIEKGHNPKSYINPRNGRSYIYLDTNLEPNTIYKKHKELSKLDYLESIWIIKINL